MELIQNNAVIPKYTLQQSSSNGNDLIEMTLCDGKQFAKRKVDFLIPHRKDFYVFVMVRKGSSRHWVDMTPYSLKENTFYVASPWQVHVKEKSEPLQGIILSFNEEFLNMDESKTIRQLPIILNSLNAHELCLQPRDASFIEDTLGKMYTEYEGNNEWRYIMLLSYLRILAIYTSRLYTEQYEKNNSYQERLLLQQFKSLINDRFTQLHQVSGYAQLLYISSGYLNEVVKEQSGKTAIEHIHERIVLEAKRKLFHTELSVKEIGYDLGFEDAAYFNRFFKRLTGQTPSSFRRSTREMYN
jgi:AraC family transcriptional regulator, transcriptional activator of pobA